MTALLFWRMKQLAILILCSFFGLYLVTVSMEKKSYTISNSLPLKKKVPEKSIELLEEEQVKRKQMVRDTCSLTQSNIDMKTVISNKDMLDHLIVDDEHKLLYCYIPKVACTNWKRVLMVLMGKVNTSDPLSIVADDSHRNHVFRRLSNYSSEEVQHRLEHFRKFMFVRHPLERLLSAYRNKFYQNYSSSQYFRVRYGINIVKKYRPNASNESLQFGHDVTFTEFVKYLIDPETRSKTYFNEHWRPMVELCSPCHIHYDVIGKYETLLDDAWLVLHKAKLDHLIEFPQSQKPSSTSSLIGEYIAPLTQQQLSDLYHIYQLDFALFDYHHPHLHSSTEAFNLTSN